MNKSSFTILKLSFLLPLLMILTSGQAVAGKLTIVNGDQNKGTVFTFSPQAGQYECFYNREHFLGSKHSVGPGESFSFHVNRTCSGGGAQFSIYTEDQKRIKFEMHGDDEFLYIETTPANGGYACTSENCLTRNAMDGSSSFTTNVVAKVASEDLATGKGARADWSLICNKPCNKSISVTITKGTSDETVTSQEATKSIADSLTVGVELPYGVSVEGTHSEESSTTMGKEFSHAVTYEQSTENSETVEYSAEDFSNYGIESIWQWVAMVPMRSNKISIVKTKKYTCTSDGKKPTYLPGSPEDVGSCNTEVEKELSAKEKIELEILQLNLARAKAQAAAPAATTSAGFSRNQLENEFRTYAKNNRHRTATDHDFTTSLYWRHLGHGPDGNLALHTGRITSGSMTREQLEEEFRTYAKTERHRTSTNRDFTISLYWRHLGHAPDANLDYHISRLN